MHGWPGARASASPDRPVPLGGIVKLTRDSESPGEESRVTAAGPAVTLLIVLVGGRVGIIVGGTSDFVDAASWATTRAPRSRVLVSLLVTLNSSCST